MRRGRSSESLGPRRWRFSRWKFSHLLPAVGSLYLVFIAVNFHRFLEIGTAVATNGGFAGTSGPLQGFISTRIDALHRRLEDSPNPIRLPRNPIGSAPIEPFWHRHAWNRSGSRAAFDRSAGEAWALGLKAWEELESDSPAIAADGAAALEGEREPCPPSVSAEALARRPAGEQLVPLPCGLARGSSVTVVGTPRPPARPSGASGRGPGSALVSQFVVELQGLRAVDGEEPPKILHLNPRLSGDWSRKQVIEHNTCYRMKWGTAMRCAGSPSSVDDGKVDGFVICEKWVGSDAVDSTDSTGSKTTSWLRRFIGRANKPAMTWPFPFVEGRLFVLTLRAGIEGFHIFVAGRHISSFPYRRGFTLEDATGLAITGDVDINSVYATSLPMSHPNSSQQMLEMSEKWKARPLPENPVDLFIGILSSTNHFAERMAVRKTWMQSSEIRSPNVVARFFVALSPRKEVNAVLKMEAEYFGDIVILPFVDHYELVVMKTIAICEYAVRNLAAAYIMKCDDDTFVRVNAVLNDIHMINHKNPLYMGNLNFLHRPLRHGKWAVTYEEWPEAIYPTYANGACYIISNDIATFVASQHTNHSLRLFKMEDVSMGMWVKQFNVTTPVQYSHTRRFVMSGCLPEYYSAHYQSPGQMTCLWDKLAGGRADCCNLR